MVLGGGGELHVTGGVQRSLDGVLNDADDETDADDLHSDIIGDAEQRACHRDEQQRAARDAGSAARAQRGHNGQQDGGRHTNIHAQRVGRSQRHDGNGDGRTVHVDGRAQGDGDRVNVLVQPQLLTQGHVDRDVGGRAAGEEGGQAAFTQAAEHQRVGIAVQVDEDNQWVNDQRHEQHRAHQQQQQAAVLGKDGQAVVRHVGKHQTHDAEGSHVDDPAHNGGNRVRRVGHKVFGGVAAQTLHSQAKQAGPHQDADVVAVHDGRHRIGDDVRQQRVHDVTQALGNHVRSSSLGQHQRLGEQLAGHDAERRRHKGGEHIQPNDRAEAAVQLGRALRQRTGDNDENQHRGNALQRADKQAAEFFQPYGAGADQCQRRADKQTDGNTQDQAGLVVLGGQRLDRLGELIHVKLLYLIIIVGHVLQGVRAVCSRPHRRLA